MEDKYNSVCSINQRLEAHIMTLYGQIDQMERPRQAKGRAVTGRMKGVVSVKPLLLVCLREREMEGMQLDNKYFTKPYNPPVPSKVCLHNQKRRDFFIRIATSLCKVWFCE